MLIDFGSTTKYDCDIDTCTNGMSILAQNPSIEYDLSCLYSTIGHLITLKIKMYSTREILLGKIIKHRARYPNMFDIMSTFMNSTIKSSDELLKMWRVCYSQVKQSEPRYVEGVSHLSAPEE